MLSGPPSTTTSSGPLADQLVDSFVIGSVRQRRALLSQLQQRSPEVRPLATAALDRLNPTGDDWAPGVLIQLLLSRDDDLCRDFLARHPDGWLAAPSARGLDYGPLQRHLMQQDFEQADRLTSTVLRQLAGPAAEQRGYVYYSEVPPMPAVDLESLDRLWLTYSQGRFGFSVQARLLRSLGGRWEQLWPRIGWKADGIWTRYPAAFTWNLAAPEGHLPLVNQLRGVRLMDALLLHPAVSQRVTA